ncbi:MAG: 50S ribosomal protein L18 [Phycisphaerae bacterium]|jgi:large subunit ribosomal protein L18|nr:50S ribosomal protein L18 [Phycisphaerae bacterium]
MNRIVARLKRRAKRRHSVRKNIFGMPSRPRMTITRTGKNVYVQIIDDTAGKTVASASTIEKGNRQPQGSNCAAAAQIGTRIAEKAKEAGVDTVVFDRNGYKFHGRVKALADAAREGGLKF